MERITGQKLAGDITVEVGLLMTPESLLGDEDVPALLAGYGPIPAAIGRQLGTSSKAWLRRLFTDPVSGDLTHRDRTRRRFDPSTGSGQAARAGFIRDRDQQCRRPYCDCRIRDIDHLDPFNGSNTTADNAQGLCKRSHTTKHLPGWHVEVTDTGTTWTTPTSHQYHSNRPELRGFGYRISTPKLLDDESAAERRLVKVLAKPSLHRRQ